jgi:hypothetical protein
VGKLTLTKLKRRLETTRLLPKDELIDSGRRRLSDNPHLARDRRIERALLQALTGPGTTATERVQALAQANCSLTTPCRYLTCWLCKHLAWRRWRKRVHGVVGHDAGVGEISWVTIVVAVATPSPERLTQLMSKFRYSLRAAIGDPGVRLIGRFEIDLLLPGAPLGTIKKRTLLELGYDGRKSRPIALIHVHLFAVHPGLHRGILAYRLKKAFHGFRRTQVKPHDRKQSAEVSIDNLSRYMLKSLPPEILIPKPNSRLCKPTKPSALRLYNNILLWLCRHEDQCIIQLNAQKYPQ